MAHDSWWWNFLANGPGVWALGALFVAAVICYAWFATRSLYDAQQLAKAARKQMEETAREILKKELMPDVASAMALVRESMQEVATQAAPVEKMRVDMEIASERAASAASVAMKLQKDFNALFSEIRAANKEAAASVAAIVNELASGAAVERTRELVAKMNEVKAVVLEAKETQGAANAQLGEVKQAIADAGVVSKAMANVVNDAFLNSIRSPDKSSRKATEEIETLKAMLKAAQEHNDELQQRLRRMY